MASKRSVRTGRAAFIRAPFRVEIREVPIPVPQWDEVLLRIRTCGICGTDVHLAKSWAPDWQRFGHEAVGEVIEFGAGVTDLAVGDHVALHGASACWVCEFCMNGQPDHCPNFRQHRQLYSFADYIAVQRRGVWKVNDLPLDIGTLVEPLAVALDVDLTANVAPMSDVVVVGPGPIGLMVVALCRQRAASQIIVVGTALDVDRFPIARAMGATATLSTSTDDVPAALRDLTEGRGAPSVIVTAPPAAVPMAIDLAAYGGAITFVGFDDTGTGAKAEIDLNRFHFQRLQLRASFLAPAMRFPVAARLLRDKIVDGEKLITHRGSLEELPDLLHLVAEHRDGAIKAVVELDR